MMMIVMIIVVMIVIMIARIRIPFYQEWAVVFRI